MARVLLADSQPLFNEALEALFSRDDVHQVIAARRPRTPSPPSPASAPTWCWSTPPSASRLAQPGRPHAGGLSRGAGDRARRRPRRRPAAGRDPRRRRRRGGQDLRRQHGAAGRRGGARRRGRSPGACPRAGPPHGLQGPGTRLAAVAPVPRERQVLALLSKGWDAPASGGTCSSASTPSAPTSRTSSRSSACTPSSRRPPSPCSAPWARADHRRRRDGPLTPRTTTDHKEHAL